MKRLALLMLVVGACKSDQAGPRCEQVVDHMLEVTKQQMPAHGGMGELGDRKAMIAQCNKRNLTAEQRKCLMAAKSLGEIANCGPASGPPPRPPAADPIPVPPPSVPAEGTVPTPSGSGS
jgi:hypothetical protein